MVHKEKYDKDNQNVQKIVKEDDKNETNDAAGNVTTHGWRGEKKEVKCSFAQMFRWREKTSSDRMRGGPGEKQGKKERGRKREPTR